MGPDAPSEEPKKIQPTPAGEPTTSPEETTPVIQSPSATPIEDPTVASISSDDGSEQAPVGESMATDNVPGGPDPTSLPPSAVAEEMPPTPSDVPVQPPMPEPTPPSPPMPPQVPLTEETPPQPPVSPTPPAPPKPHSGMPKGPVLVAIVLVIILAALVVFAYLKTKK